MTFDDPPKRVSYAYMRWSNHEIYDLSRPTRITVTMKPPHVDTNLMIIAFSGRKDQWGIDNHDNDALTFAVRSAAHGAWTAWIRTKMYATGHAASFDTIWGRANEPRTVNIIVQKHGHRIKASFVILNEKGSVICELHDHFAADGVTQTGYIGVYPYASFCAGDLLIEKCYVSKYKQLMSAHLTTP